MQYARVEVIAYTCSTEAVCAAAAAVYNMCVHVLLLPSHEHCILLD
jgi:hypothetical protein